MIRDALLDFRGGGGGRVYKKERFEEKKGQTQMVRNENKSPQYTCTIQKINNSMTQLPITHPEYLMFPLGQMIEVPLVGTYSSGWLVNQSKDFLDQSLDQRDINISHHLNIK